VVVVTGGAVVVVTGGSVVVGADGFVVVVDGDGFVVVVDGDGFVVVVDVVGRGLGVPGPFERVGTTPDAEVATRTEALSHLLSAGLWFASPL